MQVNKTSHGFDPDKAAAYLHHWLFDNFLHPYPDDKCKKKILKVTACCTTGVHK